MSPRPDVSTERKSQILDAAETVLAKKGFEAARMEDIADKTGLSKGTLYLYFKSKDKLISAILDRMFQREFSQLEKMKNEDTGAAEMITRLTELVIQDILSMLRLIPIFFNFLALAFRSKYVKKALEKYINRYLEIFIPIIERGIVSGEFRPMDASEAAIAGSAIIEGTILLWTYDSRIIDPEHHIRSGMSLLLEGMKKHAP